MCANTYTALHMEMRMCANFVTCLTAARVCVCTLATEAKRCGKYHHFQEKIYVMKGLATIMRSHRNNMFFNGRKREGKLWKNALFY